MTDEPTGTCTVCGSRVPIQLLPEHLAEHFPDLTAQEVRDAPVYDRTGDDAEEFAHNVERVRDVLDETWRWLPKVCRDNVDPPSFAIAIFAAAAYEAGDDDDAKRTLYEAAEGVAAKHGWEEQP
jgi:hypothetical protein